jgi:hypothetical protein
VEVFVRSVLLLAAVLFIAGCKSTPEYGHHDHTSRTPSATNEEISQSAEFKAHETARQHTFILLDAKGHFGYHVTQFRSGHQHQFIVRSEVKRGKNLFEAPFAQAPTRKYWSVTSNKPQFFLRELFESNPYVKGAPPARTSFPGTRYDGLIIDRPTPLPKERDLTFTVKSIIFNSPMIAEEMKIPNATHVIFGSYGKPKKRHFLAHLIKGANNYEQLVAVDFENDVVIDNGALMVLGTPDAEPLKEGQGYEGTINGAKENQKFTVIKEVYRDNRTAEGFN